MNTTECSDYHGDNIRLLSGKWKTKEEYEAWRKKVLEMELP